MHSTMYCKNQTQHISTNIQTVKHTGGEVIVWACFASTGPGHFTVTDLTMNSLYTKVF